MKASAPAPMIMACYFSATIASASTLRKSQAPTYSSLTPSFPGYTPIARNPKTPYRPNPDSPEIDRLRLKSPQCD